MIVASVDEIGDVESRYLHFTLGIATSILLDVPLYYRMPIGSLSLWVLPPARLKRLRFFLDTNGSPIGFITWAHVSDEVDVRLRTERSSLLHISEWNDGLNLWIISLVSPYVDLRSVIRSVSSTLFGEDERLTFIVPKGGREVIHSWARCGAHSGNVRRSVPVVQSGAASHSK